MNNPGPCLLITYYSPDGTAIYQRNSDHVSFLMINQKEFKNENMFSG